jgi:hypothetical protein
MHNLMHNLMHSLMHNLMWDRRPSGAQEFDRELALSNCGNSTRASVGLRQCGAWRVIAMAGLWSRSG